MPVVPVVAANHLLDRLRLIHYSLRIEKTCVYRVRQPLAPIGCGALSNWMGRRCTDPRCATGACSPSSALMRCAVCLPVPASRGVLAAGPVAVQHWPSIQRGYQTAGRRPGLRAAGAEHARRKGEKGRDLVVPQSPLPELRYPMGQLIRRSQRLADLVDGAARTRWTSDAARQRLSCRDARPADPGQEAAGAAECREAALPRGPGRSGDQLAARAWSRRFLI